MIGIYEIGAEIGAGGLGTAAYEAVWERGKRSAYRLS
jgi:ABC-type proline/glycine betaine transport system permease subunit